MDAITIKKMGETVNINGVDHEALPAELSEQMGPLSGTGICLVIFSESYVPRRNDRVVFDGTEYIITRHDRFNGKPRIYLE